MDVQGISDLWSTKHKVKSFDEHGPSFFFAEEHKATNFGIFRHTLKFRY